MIVVDATVWRFGNESNQDNILQLIIVNDASGTPSFGNYNVYEGRADLVRKPDFDITTNWKLVGRITDYDRRNGGAYLVGLALDVYNQTGEAV